MAQLWRCDICFALIDPAEGDSRNVLEVSLDEETSELDLCDDCSPESIGDHMDWMTFKMEKETGDGSV